MATMQATAVISAIDRASPVFARVSAAAQAAAKRHEAIAASFSRVGTLAAAAVALPAVAGFSALINKTQEFERLALSIKNAAIPDAFVRVGDAVESIDFNKLNQEGARARETAMRLSKELGVLPTKMMAAQEAAAKMGMEGPLQNALATQAGIWSLDSKEMSPEQGVEFLGKLATQFKAPTDPEAFAEWAKVTADAIKTLADASPTSLRPFAEGLRQYSALWAQLGGSIQEMAALSATASKMGQGDIDFGTAAKMAQVRALVPDTKLLESWARAGMRRGDYMDVTAQDPIRATNNLITAFNGYLKKGDRKQIRDLLRTHTVDNDASNAVGPIAALITGRGKGAIPEEDARLRVANAIMTGGGKFNSWKYLLDTADQLESGKISMADVVARFTGQHASRLMAVLKPKELREYLKLAKEAKGLGQDARLQNYKDSDFGKWESALASIERGLVKLRSSEGVRSLIGTFETLAEKIASLPPGVVDAGGKFMLAAAGFAAFGIAAKGVAAAMTVLAGNPIMRSLLIAGATMGGLDIFRTLEPGTRPWSEMQQPEWLGQSSPIVQAFNELERTASTVASLVGDITRDVTSLFSADPTDSPFVAGLRLIRDMLTRIKTTTEWVHNQYKQMTGKEPVPQGFTAPADPHGTPAQKSLSYLEAFAFVLRSLIRGEIPGQNKPSEPTKVEGNVTGQANVNITVTTSPDLQARLDFAKGMRLNGQLGNGTGTSMPDGQAPAPPQQ